MSYTINTYVAYMHEIVQINHLDVSFEYLDIMVGQSCLAHLENPTILDDIFGSRPTHSYVSR